MHPIHGRFPLEEGLESTSGSLVGGVYAISPFDGRVLSEFALHCLAAVFA